MTAADRLRGGTGMNGTAVRLGQARSLTTVDAPAAVTLLRRSLASRNPYTAPVEAGLRDLAELYVRLTIDSPAETATLGWAAYLRRATLGRHGEADARTRDIDRLVVELAQHRGTTVSPVGLLSTLTTSHVDGGSRASRTVAARFCVVDLLHACGLCETAEREAIAALCQWAPHHHDAPDVTYTYLVETLAALDHCGRIRQGRSVLNAYGAMLPEAGTDGDAFLRACVRIRLGDRRQIQCHEYVCGARRRLHRPRPRRSYEDLRAAVLRWLAGGDHGGEGLSTPRPPPELSRHVAPDPARVGKPAESNVADGSARPGSLTARRTAGDLPAQRRSDVALEQLERRAVLVLGQVIASAYAGSRRPVVAAGRLP